MRIYILYVYRRSTLIFVLILQKVNIQRQERTGDESSMSSFHASDEDIVDSGSDGDDDGQSVHSQETEDDDGVMPGGGDISPIDDLQSFDWGDADKELQEFMDGSDDESDNGSVAMPIIFISNT
jgi:hypothetical protein